MKHELELQLQAYLDGELAGRDAAEIAALLARDAEAVALLGELRNTRTAMLGNELEIKLPETREFYWSKIEREITRLESAPAAAPSDTWWAALRRRHVTALSGLSVALVLVLAAVVNIKTPGTFDVEDLLEETGSLSYRSESQKTSVVWLYDKEQPETETPGDEALPPQP